MSAALGWLWPARQERALLALGRAVGLGERLATLQALSDQPTAGVATLLASEVRRCPWRLWRLAAGRWELGAVVVGVAILASLWVPLGGDSPTPDVVTTTEEPNEDIQQEAEEMERPEAHVPSEPAGEGTAGYTPYTDLFAATLGLEDAGELWADPEALADALAEQQGLLREIAEHLPELASPGGDVQAAREVAGLASELAREDLRDIVLEAASSGGKDEIAQAAEAVDTVLEAQDALEDPADALDGPPTDTTHEGEELPPDRAEGQPATDEGEVAAQDATGDGWQEQLPDGALDFLDMNGVPGDQPAHGETPPDDDSPPQRGGPPGAAHAEPPPEGDFEAPMVDPDEPAVPAKVRAEDGEWRAYLVVDVPGESPGELGEPVELSPQEVDLLLRTRGVPPELREVVRRYFEQMAVEGEGER
ncbi:MAG: hypothetical protein R6U88_05440 [Candidatus Bipolaricaulota bacterium]